MSAELPVAARRSACLYLACSSAAAVGCVGPGMGTGLGVGLGADLGWNWDWGLAASAGSFAFCKQARRTIQKQMLSMRIKRTAVDFIRMLDAFDCLSGVHEYRAVTRRTSACWSRGLLCCGCAFFSAGAAAARLPMAACRSASL